MKLFNNTATAIATAFNQIVFIMLSFYWSINFIDELIDSTVNSSSPLTKKNRLMLFINFCILNKSTLNKLTNNIKQ